MGMEVLSELAVAWPAVVDGDVRPMSSNAVRHAIEATPPWQRRGIVEWLPNPGDTCWRTVPAAAVESYRLVHPSLWPSTVLQRMLLGTDDAEGRSARKTADASAMFALSPFAKQLQNLDAVFAGVPLDGPEPGELRRIDAWAARDVLPCAAPDWLTLLSGRSDAIQLNFHSAPNDDDDTTTPPRAARQGSPDGAAVDRLFGGGTDIAWTTTAKELAAVLHSVRYTVTEVPKSLACILLTLFREPERLAYLAAQAECTALADLGSLTALHAARLYHQNASRRFDAIASLPREVLSPTQVAVSDLSDAAVAWAARRRDFHDAASRFLQSDDAQREAQRWGDILDALRSAFAEEPNREMTGLSAADGVRAPVQVDHWLNTLTISDLADRMCRHVQVLSLTSSPAALLSEADMMNVTVDYPANVAGPKAPRPVHVVMCRLIDFDAPRDVDRVFKVPSRQGKDETTFFTSAPVLIRPSGEAAFYKRLCRTWDLVLRTAFEGIRATDLVLTPVLNLACCTALIGLSEDDMRTILSMQFAALFDVMERYSGSGGARLDRGATVYLCGDAFHAWAVTAFTAKPRRIKFHVVLHETDSKSLALNLAEQDGRGPDSAVALLCPADVHSITFGTHLLPLEALRLEQESEDWLPTLEHWNVLGDASATTTLFLSSGPCRIEAASVLDDHNATSWAPFEPANVTSPTH